MSKQKRSKTNYQWYLKAETSKYAGEWVAIANQKIVAHGDSAFKVRKKASQKHPQTKIALAKIPKEELLILVIFS